MKRRVLIVDDDKGLSRLITDALRLDGYDVEWTGDGEQALACVRQFIPDLILLDVMLPNRSGFSLCGILREQSGVPIIILSARGQKADRLKGLALGADDYLAKPFDLDELLARIKVVLRRSHPALTLISYGDVTIDFAAQRASYGDAEIRLTQREFDVLRYLAQRRDRVVYRSELLREVWGYLDAPIGTRSVDQAIVRLRKKLEPDPHRPCLIRTVHGDGYRINSISECED